MPGTPSSYSSTTRYAYDYGQTQSPQMNRSQLTQETSTRNGSYTNVFGYDGGTSGGPGNPTSFKGTTSAFNADNQTTSAGYAYDGNGNPTTYRSLAYTFDPENRLASVGTARLGTTNAYDGDGHLVWSSTSTDPRSLNTQELFRLYDGEQPVGFYPIASNEKRTAQPPATTNTYGADGLVSVCSTYTAASVFYTFDERGNVAQRTSSTGAVLSSDVYDAYGTQTTTATTADSVGFGGQWGYYTDSNFGLILCTHRYFDPATGRWLTRDPISYDGGINLYGYCGNDPVNRWDPSGESWAGVGVGIVVTVVVVVLITSTITIATGGAGIVAAPIVVGAVDAAIGGVSGAAGAIATDQYDGTPITAGSVGGAAVTGAILGPISGATATGPAGSVLTKCVVNFFYHAPK